MCAIVGIAENMYRKTQWCHNFLKEVDFSFLAIIRNSNIKEDIIRATIHRSPSYLPFWGLYRLLRFHVYRTLVQESPNSMNKVMHHLSLDKGWIGHFLRTREEIWNWFSYCSSIIRVSGIRYSLSMKRIFL